MEVENRQLRMKRMFKAPVELVWEAWTKPEHISKWWGPNGFTTTIHKMDFEEGGEWKLTMHGPGGSSSNLLNCFLTLLLFHLLNQT